MIPKVVQAEFDGLIHPLAYLRATAFEHSGHTDDAAMLLHKLRQAHRPDLFGCFHGSDLITAR